jgi:hypothetical protein
LKRLGTIIGGTLVLVLIVVFFVFRIFFNVVENIRLVTTGTVTQGIIVNNGMCGKRHSYPLFVQFTDTKGKQQDAAAANACGSINIPFRQEGEHVSIVYLPSDPQIARIQSDLVLQFWVLEVPFLLLALLILLLALRGLSRQYVKS